MKIKEIYDFLDEIAPFSTAAEWDNTGLCIGSLEKPVSKVLLALDVTHEVIRKANEWGAELVLTHHPLMFAPVSSIDEGSVLCEAVRSCKTYISSHTCLDIAQNGVNDCLASAVGINNIHSTEQDIFLKIGEIEPATADAFAEEIKASLGGAVTYTDSGRVIKKVAICSGSGGDLVAAAAQAGADALLTGEAKHHHYLEANALGISLFSAGHFETENVVLDYLKTALKEKFEGLQVEVFSPVPANHI